MAQRRYRLGEEVQNIQVSTPEKFLIDWQEQYSLSLERTKAPAREGPRAFVRFAFLF
jgi:hypothetical protein